MTNQNPTSPSEQPSKGQPTSPNQPNQRKRIGEFLVEAGFITPSHVEVALLDQSVTGHRLGEIMVLRGWVDQPTVDSIVKLQAEGGSAPLPRPAEVANPQAPLSSRQVVLGSVEQQDVDTVAMNIDELKRQMAEEEAQRAKE